jgi:hypothetical protein
MNHALYKTMCDAECRYLTDSEMDAFRDWGGGMANRMDAAKRIEEREPAILMQACSLFFERNPEARTPEREERLRRELSTTLKFVAAAHIRDDLQFFRRSYAGWVGELLRTTGMAAQFAQAQQCLKVAIADGFDPFEAKAISKYIDAVVEELSRVS